MAKVAWIGLGVMGFPMAGHVLKRGGHDLAVYNRTAAKADHWFKRTDRAVPRQHPPMPPGMPISCSLASATTMICAK